MTGEQISSNGLDAGIRSQQLVTLGSSVGAGSGQAVYEDSAIGADRSGEKRRQLSVKPRLPDTAQAASVSNAGRRKGRPEDRDALRRYWEMAEQRAAGMEHAARSGDYMELSNLAQDLLNLLDDLWQLREIREDDWRGILNFTQGVLKGEEFESLQPAQCLALRTVITDYLGPATVDKDDVRNCLRVLRRAGFDPWRPISGEPEV